MKNIYFLEKLSKILKIKQDVGALEISDNVIRHLNFNGKNWVLNGVRLAPGIMSNGEIKDYKAFVEALYELRRQIFKNKKSSKKLNVLVTLSSIDVYTQIFNLPLIEGENLQKSIDLNLKMIAPKDISKLYSSWEIIEESKQFMHIEVLASFIDKKIIDDLTKALIETNFIVRSIEFKNFSLARFMREKVLNFDKEKFYLVVTIDDSGIKTLILKNGKFYFEYFSFWNELSANEKEILWSKFESGFNRHLHQVINFYNSRFNEELEGVFLITSSFRNKIVEIINSNFNIKVLDFILNENIQINPEWFAIFGVWLRGKISPKKDKELNLLGIESFLGFMEHQIIQFFEFWKLLLSFSFGIGILVLFISYLFLSSTLSSLKEKTSAIKSGKQVTEIKTLQNNIEEFNKLTAMIKNIENSYLGRNLILEKIIQKVKENNIIIQNLSFEEETKKINLLAFAQSEDDISKFKKSLESDQFFASIDLPFSEIKSSDAGKVFSISFVINPSKMR
jgi:hypothetical protein